MFHGYSKAKNPPWLMVFDLGHTVDGIGFDSFEAAKEDALDTLIEWEAETMSDWKSSNPTEDEIEHWDYMIYSCSVEVQKYNPEKDEYEEYWSPSYEDEKLVGWMEWKELQKLIQEGSDKQT